jgi:glycosyltransferase involved in cell wall biosynthesis
MNVIFYDDKFPPPILGGKEKQAFLLYDRLSENKVNVKVLSFQLHSEIREIAHDVTRYNNGLFNRIKLIFNLIYQHHFQKYKILHVHVPSRSGVILVIIGWLFGYKTVLKMANQELLNNLEGIDKFIWRIALNVVDRFVVLENDTLTVLKELGVPDDRLFYTVNGVINTKDDKLRANFDKDVYKIIFVGRLVEQKRCSDIIEALSKIDPNINWKFTIAGEGPLEKQLKQIAYTNLFSHKIEFIGRVDNTEQLMLSSDLLILASKKEGMSNSVLEAMSVGLPVIASRVGAINEQLGKYSNECTFEVGDIGGITNLINRILTDCSYRNEYSNYLKNRSEQLFNINVVAKKYIQMYNDMLKK